MSMIRAISSLTDHTGERGVRPFRDTIVEMAQLAPEGALPTDGRLLAHGLPFGVELLYRDGGVHPREPGPV